MIITCRIIYYISKKMTNKPSLISAISNDHTKNEIVFYCRYVYKTINKSESKIADKLKALQSYLRYIPPVKREHSNSIRIPQDSNA